MDYVVAHNLSVRLGRRPALAGAAFAFRRGAFNGLVGPNGSGKTTLLRAVAGLVPYEGSLLLDGREVRAWKPGERARKAAFVRQTTALDFDFNVTDLVLLGRMPGKRWTQPYTDEDRRRALDALAEVDLLHLRDRSATALSGGELQRVLLAQALARDAELLMLDEPTAHLDVHHQHRFLERAALRRAGGCTVVGVFHDLELAARFCDHLVALRDGCTVAAGAPAAVLTPDLLADVFRMRARVHAEPTGGLRIHYLAPTP